MKHFQFTSSQPLAPRHSQIIILSTSTSPEATSPRFNVCIKVTASDPEAPRSARQRKVWVAAFPGPCTRGTARTTRSSSSNDHGMISSLAEGESDQVAQPSDETYCSISSSVACDSPPLSTVHSCAVCDVVVPERCGYGHSRG